MKDQVPHGRPSRGDCARSRRKALTRNRILSAATDAICEEGLHRVGIARLMGRIGLTHGGFYAHFPSKADLALETIDAIFDNAVAALRAALDGYEPQDALTRYIDLCLLEGDVDDAGQGCVLSFLAAEVHRLGPAACDHFSMGTSRLYVPIAACFRALGQSEDDAVLSAISLFAELVGAICLSRAAATDQEARRIKTSAMTSLSRRLTNGLGSPGGGNLCKTSIGLQ